MSSFELMPRAGQVNLNIGTSSAGDDARTLEIPFDTLDASGFPRAIKLSIESSTGVSIPQNKITCQAFRDVQGTITLGSTFTDSTAASLGSSPVEVGSIFCSDAKGIQARINAAGTTNTVSASLATTEINHPSSTVATAESQATPLSPASKSVAPIQSIGDSKPETLQQPPVATHTTATEIPSYVAATSISTVSASTSQDRDTLRTTSLRTMAPASDSAVAQQTTSGTTRKYVHDDLTLKRILCLVFVTTCYLGLFSV